MSWSDANSFFNPVARALIDTGASDQTKRVVLGRLIGQLKDIGWDTEHESLADFLDDPAIVAAFSDHDVHLYDRRRCRAVHAKNPRARLLAMRHDEVSEDEMTAAIDAYSEHLAERIHAAGDHVRGPTTCSQIVNDPTDVTAPEEQW
ncbi:hypothetical protein [Streptomyces chartreusis]|uniref:hypothetical protein n=1 Tax=Streptomyces chartreusis TaxID=1969 RepID=UPI00380D5855